MSNKHFLLASIAAFAGMILLMNVGSAFADKHHINALFAIPGALLTLGAAGWIGYKYAKQGGNPNRYQ